MSTSRTVVATLAVLAVILTVTAFTNSGSAVIQGMKPLLVRNFDAPAARSFQVELCRETNVAACDATPSDILVPTITSAGESVARLVIEHVSARCSYVPNTGFISNLLLFSLVNGVEASHSFTPVIGASQTSVSMVTPVRIYADPGTDLLFVAGMVATSGWCRMTVSGHFAVL